MLKQLRKRFILITMLLVGIVLLMITFIICYKTYTQQTDKLNRQLDAGLMMHSSIMNDDYSRYGNGPDSGNGPDGKGLDDMRERLSSFYVILNSSNEIMSCEDNYTSLSYDEILDAVDKVIATDSSSGKIKKYKLRYKVKDNTSYKIFSFVDYTTVHEEMSKSIVFAFLLFAGTMIVFLMISIWLSGYAMKPVAKAWAQQHQFVADASHELKTPLTAILANNNILLSKPDSTISEQKKWIENSQAEAHHMKDLINNMLFLAKSDDEKVQLLFSEVSLTDIVFDTTLQFEPVAFENGILIDSDIEKAITMQADLTQMRQLVHILIDNACKYAGENGHVYVALKKVSGNIKLEVKNTGNPIPPDDLPHIFERFYRSDKVRTQQNQEGGYGLGLAIAKSIVERHKGIINAASTVSDGTKFTVTFKNK